MSEMTEQQSRELETKTLGTLEVKDVEKGEVEAVIATLGVVDHDGDVIADGAIKNGSKVKMSSYGHDIVFGELPVGRGTVQVEGNKAVFRGKLFLSTNRGREVFGVLKEMGADQEWSFGYRVQGAEVPDEGWKQKGAQRILTKLDTFEVSPVLRGAGIGTGTVSVKGAQEPKAEPEEEAAPEPEATPDPVEAEAKAAEEKAAAEAEAARMEEEARAAAVAAEMKELAAREFERFQRTARRLGLAA